MGEPSPTPRYRGERRSTARSKSKNTTSPKHFDALAEIPLIKPDFDSQPTTGHKTLYDIAAERQAQLEREGFYDKDKMPQERIDSTYWPDDEPMGPLGNAVVWTFSLIMLHFTLDVLTFQQYRQKIEWGEIWQKTFTTIPALFVIVYMLRTETALRWTRLRQCLFFVASVSAGCFLIKSGNKDGYYAVMKKAPPIGTLWVWSCIEMDLWWAVGHVAVIACYMWWNGFGNF